MFQAPNENDAQENRHKTKLKARFDKCEDKDTCFDLFDERDSVTRKQSGRRPSIKDQPSGTMNVGT